jgi:hypothetical protein
MSPSRAEYRWSKTISFAVALGARISSATTARFSNSFRTTRRYPQNSPVDRTKADLCPPIGTIQKPLKYRRPA